MNQIILEATKKILEKNLKINTEPFNQFPVIVVYDLECELTKNIWEWYAENLKNRENSEVIIFEEIEAVVLKEKLMSLPEFSSVVLIQSRDFRLDDFRIRLNLHNKWVWCLEHNHLIYLKSGESDTYIDAIKYRWEEYNRLSNKFKDISDNAGTAKIVCHNWDTLEISGGFEDMKQNIWEYWERRGSTLPLWENFSESKVFENVNWKLSVTCYPDSDMNIHFCEAFTIEIKNSFITCSDEKCPEIFREFLERIARNEDNEVMMRELGFWLNPAITNKTPLNDVNAFERKAGFHISMWKKHGIFRKKLHRKVNQRFHIDVFPDVKEIFFDDMLIFSEGKYVI
jgi:hypothetical protein